jgi:tRNA dimethylallyltransferase
MTRPMLLALVGPTASGKTEASLVVAEALGAEVVSVDSMLVYRGMDAGTAKPTAAQRSRVRHHLLDLADPSEPFSVAAYRRSADAALEDISRRGKVALLVGGSGLYLRAIVDRLEFPATSAPTRALLEAEASALGPQALHSRLQAFDPVAAARIEPSNTRRVVRALEVAAITARPFSSFATDWERYPPDAVRAAGIDIPRDVLHARIERRVAAMWPDLLVETEALAAAGSSRFLTSTQAIGYAEALATLAGSLSEEDARRGTIRRTKALARRQMAWFRRDPRIRWFGAGADGAGAIADELAGFLGRSSERVEA